jgi:hypothetical protein
VYVTKTGTNKTRLHLNPARDAHAESAARVPDMVAATSAPDVSDIEAKIQALVTFAKTRPADFALANMPIQSNCLIHWGYAQAVCPHM